MQSREERIQLLWKQSWNAWGRALDAVIDRQCNYDSVSELSKQAKLGRVRSKGFTLLLFRGLCLALRKFGTGAPLQQPDWIGSSGVDHANMTLFQGKLGSCTE